MKESIFSSGIYYRENKSSAADRPTLVFVHGLSGSSSAWLKYEEVFKNDHNIISIDLRGHGKSLKFKNFSDYQISELAEDLNSIVNHLKLDKFILISHSFGTLAVLEFMKKYQNKLLSSVFISPNHFVEERKLARLFQLPVWIMKTIIGFWPFFKKNGIHLDYLKYANTGDWNLRRMFFDIRNTSLKVYFYSLLHSYGADYRQFLEKIKIPVLIIHGNKDTVFPVKGSIMMSKMIKNSKLVIIEDSDHIIVFNKFPKVLAAIKDFLD